MTTTPYAKLLVSVNGGAWTSGKVTVSVGDTVSFKPESTVGVGSQRYELYDYPPGFPAPLGWGVDSEGVYYSTDPLPPDLTISPWGKYLPRLRVNNDLSKPELVDESTGIEAVSPSGLHDLADGEETQFNASWVVDMRANLRTLSTALAGAGILAIALGGTGLGTLGSPLQVLRVNAGGTALEYADPTGGLTAPADPGDDGKIAYASGGDLAYAALGAAGTVLVGGATPTFSATPTIGIVEIGAADVIVSTTGTTTARGIAVKQYGANQSGALFAGYKARGTSGSPADVIAEDVLAKFAALGYAGGAFTAWPAEIFFRVKAGSTPALSDIATELVVTLDAGYTHGRATRLAASPDAATGVYTWDFQAGHITTTGRIGVGAAVDTTIAGLFKGTTSDSTTLALDARNSGGFSSFYARDDGIVAFAGSATRSATISTYYSEGGGAAAIQGNVGDLVIIAAATGADLNLNAATAGGMINGFVGAGVLQVLSLGISACTLGDDTVTTTSVVGASVEINAGSGAVVDVIATGLQFDKGLTGTTITQATPTSDVATQSLTIAAQSAYASAASNKDGAALILKGGAPVGGEGGGSAGNVQLWAGTTQSVEAGFHSIGGSTVVATKLWGGLAFDESTVLGITVFQRTGDNGVLVLDIGGQPASSTATGSNQNGGRVFIHGGARKTGTTANHGGVRLGTPGNANIFEVGDDNGSARLGFFGGAMAAKQTITGAVSTIADAPAKAAIQSIVAALTAYGFTTDGTT